MRVIRQFSSAFDSDASIITIGTFDGIHLGHKAIIRQIVQVAQTQQIPSILITFDPHPKTIVAPHLQIKYLTSVEEKLALLKSFGLDIIAILPFDRQLAQVSAPDFITQIVHQWHPREIWVGSDFQFGQGRTGTISYLKEVGPALGFLIKTIELQTAGPTKISSTQIRSILAEGKIEKATELLGHPPFFMGQVVKGAQRGRGLGFPTANITVPSDKLWPANGVYAVWIEVAEKYYPAVANIGLRPTFEGTHQTLEVHIFNFDQDIYGHKVKVEFVTYLRVEQKFASVEALVAQISQDIQQAKHLLAAQNRD